jgi:CRP-like cAMP-binding protein
MRRKGSHVFSTGEYRAEASFAFPSGYLAEVRAVESITVLWTPKIEIRELPGRRRDLALRLLGSMSAHLRVLIGIRLAALAITLRARAWETRDSFARVLLFVQADKRCKNLSAFQVAR